MKPGTFVEAAKEWVRTGEMKIPPRHLPKRFHQREVELYGQSTRTNSTFQPPMTNGVPSYWLA
jgi:hypothetical protein